MNTNLSNLRHYYRTSMGPKFGIHACEIINALVEATEQRIRSALDEASSTLATFTDEQRSEAAKLIAQGVADGIADFAETLKR